MNIIEVTNELKKLIINNGANIVGIGKIQHIFIISFGIKYSKSVVEQLPKDDELLKERINIDEIVNVVYARVKNYLNQFKNELVPFLVEIRLV